MAFASRFFFIFVDTIVDNLFPIGLPLLRAGLAILAGMELPFVAVDAQDRPDVIANSPGDWRYVRVAQAFTGNFDYTDPVAHDGSAFRVSQINPPFFRRHSLPSLRTRRVEVLHDEPFTGAPFHGFTLHLFRRLGNF